MNKKKKDLPKTDREPHEMKMQQVSCYCELSITHYLGDF